MKSLTSKNGLTNGYKKQNKTLNTPKLSKLKAVSIISVSFFMLLIFSSLVTSQDFELIKIDGEFNDWKYYIQGQKWFEVKDRIKHYYYFQIPTEGYLRKMDTLRIWFDTDNNPNTGLLVKNLGADFRVIIQFWNNKVESASLCDWEGKEAWHFTEFSNCYGIPASSGENKVEFSLYNFVLNNPSFIAEILSVKYPKEIIQKDVKAIIPWIERENSYVWRDFVQNDGKNTEWNWLISQNLTQNFTFNNTGVGRLKINSLVSRLTLWNTSLLLNISANPIDIPYKHSSAPSSNSAKEENKIPSVRNVRTIPDGRDKLIIYNSTEETIIYIWQGKVMFADIFAAGIPSVLEIQILKSWIGIGLVLKQSDDKLFQNYVNMESQDSVYAPITILTPPDPPKPLDISGNLVVWFRDTADLTETDCTGTNDKQGLIIQGSGAKKTLTLTTGQNACWYLISTLAVLIPAGDWETLLDIQTIGDNGGSGNSYGIAAYKSLSGTCGGAAAGNCPKISYWFGGLWTTETELTTAGGAVENVRVEWNPTLNYEHWVVANSGATITVYYCSDIDICNSIGTATTQTNSIPERHWDIAIEQSSATGFLFYDNPAAVANNFCYRTFTTTLSGETCVDHSWINTTNPSFAWVDLASNPGVDTIGISAFDTTNDDSILWIWDGTAFLTGNDERICTNAGTLTNGMNAEVAFEDSANEFIAYCGDGASNANECEWSSANGWEYDDGTTNTCSAFDPNPSANNDVRTLGCSSRYATNTIICGQNDDTSDIDIWRHVGVSGLGGTHDSAFEPSFGDIGTINRDYFLAWDMENDDTGDGLVAHWDASDTRCEFKGFDNDGAAAWSGTNTFDTCTGSSNWLMAYTNPYTTDPTSAMVLRSNSNNDIVSHQWTGCYFAQCMDNEQSLSSDTTNQDYLHLDFTWAMRPVEYDVRIEIWNVLTNTVSSTIGTCLNIITRGDDIQCLISGVAQQTLGVNEIVRIKIAHSSAAGSVLIYYDNSVADGDSRATVPIPEFEIGIVAIFTVIIIFLIRRRKNE